MLKRRTFLSHSPKQTIAFAKKFARELRPGSAVSLEGNLGSGKTTFIKGVALGLGLYDSQGVKSPTFVLMHVYPTPRPLYHFDLYRLETLKELQEIGFEEFIRDPNAVSCIEWGEKAKGLLPPNVYHVNLEIVNYSSRRIIITKISQNRRPQ